MVKIRLSLRGCKKRPFYQVIVSNSKSARDGKFIEKVGFFNPLNKQKYLNIKRIKYWINCGAILSNKVKYIIKKLCK
ncbi:MAG: 30S ribosomal protein S16 [Enterobacterales bacterium]